ncbi:MAG: glycosyltransferase [Butyrivibrio sp.]|nr:glycosyltransferase [Butyrivibrio sp.]
MKKPFFTIIVVSYNPGKRIIDTIESIKKQTYNSYRVLIKDGMSTDGSIDMLREKYGISQEGRDAEGRMTLVESCDNGIYHAMNIAVSYLEEKIIDARGKDQDEQTDEVRILRAGEAPSYIYFLNCGDEFRDENVLQNVHDFIVSRQEKEGTTLPTIFYGDIFDQTTGNRISSNPHIDDYACYRNVPSHQACFYDERLMFGNHFDLKYKVRADYEQFLRCFYREKAVTDYMGITIANYEGGGYSAQNKKISEEERKEIIKHYLTGSQIRKYDFLRVVTFAKFRTFLDSNKVTSKGYNLVKNAIYNVRGKREDKKN